MQIRTAQKQLVEFQALYPQNQDWFPSHALRVLR